MRFSLQAQYAICGCFDLAYNGHGDAVQVRVVGERQGIPPRYLEQIFQRLRRAGLVAGKRGPRGGYRLARAPAEISLREVVEAVEGRPEDWVAREPGGRTRPHRPDFLWPQLAAALAVALSDGTLASLCREAESQRIPRADAEGAMYYI